MAFEVPSFILSAVAKEVWAYVTSFALKTERSEEELTEHLAAHLAMVSNWSNSVQIFNMPAAKATQKSTIPLKISSTPRRFRSALSQNKILPESALVRDAKNYILLGDPGSGKTTTLQRLAAEMFSPSAISNQYQYPILLRARELKGTGNLFFHISNILGLKFQRPERDDSPEFSMVETHVITYLNATGALVLIDGLDEIPFNLVGEVLESASKLALYSLTFKVVATCRSGDYTRRIDGFDVLELAPLGDKEIAAIAKRWASDSATFMEEARKTNYYELLNRPLFLVQLISIFNYNGTLPDRPSDAYNHIVRISLEKWDRERGINRTSKYARFSPDQKLEYLCNLSFNLTYKESKKLFSESDLKSVYDSTRKKFKLPENESIEVCRELESHTGIFVKSSFQSYEFSHLTIQEFLAATYIVKAPMIGDAAEYIGRYQAPVAIAVAISSEPSRYFSGVVLQSAEFRGAAAISGFDPNSFLSRINVERPDFIVDPVFGFACILLTADKRLSLSIVEEFLQISNVSESIAEFMLSYAYVLIDRDTFDPKEETWTIRWLDGGTKGIPFALDKEVRVASWLIRRALSKHAGSAGAASLRCVDQDDVETWLDLQPSERV